MNENPPYGSMNRDLLKKVLKFIGWIYIAYAVLMSVILLPTLIHLSLGGYRYLTFETGTAEFRLVQKNWLLGDRNEWKYKLLRNSEGFYQWHARLERVNGKEFRIKHSGRSPEWEEQYEIENVILNVFFDLPGGAD